MFTYRPAGCAPRLLLLVFHGVGRDGGPYRDHARSLADRVCAIVVAPQFDPNDFRAMTISTAASTFAASNASPLARRTVDLIPALVSWAQDAAGQPGMPYILLGHSAGAQFVDRVAAYAPVAAVRVVIANPSTWVLPDTKTAVPFGFGGLGTDEIEERAFRAYLAEPLIVLLGQDDTRQAPARTRPASRGPRGESLCPWDKGISCG